MTQAQWFTLCQLRGAVKLERIGMRHSSGKSATARTKRLLGIKGSRDKVLAELQAIIDKGPGQDWPGVK